MFKQLPFEFTSIKRIEYKSKLNFKDFIKYLGLWIVKINQLKTVDIFIDEDY